MFAVAPSRRRHFWHPAFQDLLHFSVLFNLQLCTVNQSFITIYRLQVATIFFNTSELCLYSFYFFVFAADEGIACQKAAWNFFRSLGLSWARDEHGWKHAWFTLTSEFLLVYLSGPRLYWLTSTVMFYPILFLRAKVFLDLLSRAEKSNQFQNPFPKKPLKILRSLQWPQHCFL